MENENKQDIIELLTNAGDQPETVLIGADLGADFIRAIILPADMTEVRHCIAVAFAAGFSIGNHYGRQALTRAVRKN